jgi:hypothetical protein
LEALPERCANQPGDDLASEDLLENWTDVSAEHQRRHFTRLRDCSASGREARPVPRKVLYVQSPSAFTGVEQVLVSLADAVRRKAGGGRDCRRQLGSAAVRFELRQREHDARAVHAPLRPASEILVDGPRSTD